MPRKRERIRERLLALLKQHKSPREIALGAAIGVFIAIIPLYGLHTLMVLAAAFLVRRANVVAMFIGTSINNTLTFPLITWAGYGIGRLLLGPSYPSLDSGIIRHFDFQKLLRMFVPLFIGSFVLGAVMAVAAYFAVLKFLRAWRAGSFRRQAVACAVLAVVLAGGPCLALQQGRVLKYAISPMGRAEYQERGPVLGERGEMEHVVFSTAAPGFRDVENIYSDPETKFPLRVERSVSFLFRKERLVEIYDPAAHTLVITKYVGGREVRKYSFVSDGPFQNAVTLPFNLPSASGLTPGWSTVVRIPDRYTVTLTGREEVRVPAGKFTAYRFVSSPRKFQVWIRADGDPIPLKISGLSKYSLQLSR